MIRFHVVRYKEIDGLCSEYKFPAKNRYLTRNAEVDASLCKVGSLFFSRALRPRKVTQFPVFCDF